jgi:hypothetical protein
MKRLFYINYFAFGYNYFNLIRVDPRYRSSFFNHVEVCVFNFVFRDNINTDRFKHEISLNRPVYFITIINLVACVYFVNIFIYTSFF